MGFESQSVCKCVFKETWSVTRDLLLRCVCVCVCVVLQCAAVCCRVLGCCRLLQCLAVKQESIREGAVPRTREMLHCVCGVLQFVAVCCSMLQYVAVCCSMLQCVAVRYIVLQSVAVCCSLLQCVAKGLQHTNIHVYI